MKTWGEEKDGTNNTKKRGYKNGTNNTVTNTWRRQTVGANTDTKTDIKTELTIRREGKMWEQTRVPNTWRRQNVRYSFVRSLPTNGFFFLRVDFPIYTFVSKRSTNVFFKNTYGTYVDQIYAIYFANTFRGEIRSFRISPRFFYLNHSFLLVFVLDLSWLPGFFRFVRFFHRFHSFFGLILRESRFYTVGALKRPVLRDEFFDVPGDRDPSKRLFCF